MTICTYMNKYTGKTIEVATGTDDADFCLALKAAHLFGNSDIVDWKLVGCRKSDVGCIV